MKKDYKVEIAIYSKRNNYLGSVIDYCYCENHNVAKRLIKAQCKEFKKKTHYNYKIVSCKVDLDFRKKKALLPF